jgi:hypothetical protein
MPKSQLAKRWRDHLVTRLQTRYGLTKDEASKKADVWLEWIVVPVDKDQPRSQPVNLVVPDVKDPPLPRRPRIVT